MFWARKTLLYFLCCCMLCSYVYTKDFHQNVRRLVPKIYAIVFDIMSINERIVIETFLSLSQQNLTIITLAYYILYNRPTTVLPPRKT